MIYHTVWFKLKDGVSKDEKEAMLATLRDLPDHIDTIKTLSCGYDYSGRSEGYEIGLVVTFENREGLEIYAPHPSHKAFGDNFRHLWTDVKALDFETPA